MALQDTQDFTPMLAHFPKDVQATAIWLRTWIWEQFPESNELIYEKPRALAIGWGFTDKQTDIFVSFAAYSKHVNLGFHHGHLLHDPRGLLTGSGNLYRHYKMRSIADFPKAYMEQLIQESWMNAHGRIKPGTKLIQGQTIVKSTSEKNKQS
jgi:hypothetical protein